MKTVVLVSAIAEWNGVKTIFPDGYLNHSPHGESVNLTLAGWDLELYRSGWGK